MYKHFTGKIMLHTLGLCVVLTLIILSGCPEHTTGIHYNSIATDSNGNVWTGTGYGIAKFSPSESIIGRYIPEVYVLGIAIDANGNVWVSGITSTVSNYTDASVLTALRPDGNVIQNYTTDKSGNISIDDKGNIWIADRDGSITQVSSAGVTVGTYQVCSSTNAIAIDSSGKVWITCEQKESNGTLGAIAELSPTGTTLNYYYLNNVPLGIAIDPNGNMWVSLSSYTNNLTELNINGITIGTYQAGSVLNGIAIDIYGNIWAANTEGVTELSPTGSKIKDYPVCAGAVGVAIDVSGNVWVYCPTKHDNSVTYKMTRLIDVTKGPQYFPNKGPQFSGGGGNYANF